jgi:purine nucleosidase
VAVAVPVLIDTDIGDDVDDALALVLALGSPELEVRGVTTVYQCAGLRARLARHLLAAYGRPDVPVLAGVDRPLLGAVRPDWQPNQAVVLQAGRNAAEAAAARHDAVGFIVREGMVRRDLCLLTLGALTNAALAFALEPGLAERVRVVAMAGAWDRPGAEYNVACDPEALAVLLAAGARVDFVGLDVTTAVVLEPPDLQQLLAAAEPPTTVLAAFVRAWQQASGGGSDRAPVLHDPLALAAVFAPRWLTWRTGRVAVELASPTLRGQTVLLPGASTHRVAVHVDRGFPAWCAERLRAAAARAR